MIFILVAIGFFLFRRKAGAAKEINLFASPLYILIQLTAILLIICAVLFGDMCSSVFEYAPPPILAGVDSTSASAVNQLMALRDQCSSNVSILNIATDLKMISASSINITGLMKTEIEKTNFSSMYTLLDLASVVTMNPVPSILLTPLTILDLNTLVSTTYSTLLTDLETLRTDLSSYSTNIGNSGAMITETLGTNANALAHFNGLVSGLVAQITAITTSGGLIDQIKAQVQKCIDQITAMKSELTTTNSWISNNNPTTYYTNALTQMTSYQSSVSSCLSPSVSAVKSQLDRVCDNYQSIAYANLTCIGVGRSTFQMQNQLCGTFLGGLDSMWMSYFSIAIAAALSSPILIMFANYLLPSGTVLPSSNVPAKTNSIFSFGASSKKLESDSPTTEGPKSLLGPDPTFLQNRRISPFLEFPPTPLDRPSTRGNL